MWLSGALESETGVCVVYFYFSLERTLGTIYSENESLICRIDADILTALMADRSEEEGDGRHERAAARMVEQFFSSVACLNAAFIDMRHSYIPPHKVLDHRAHFSTL